MSYPPRTQPPGHITAQQRVVLNHLANGRRYTDIAAALGVTPHTVHTHVIRLYRALGVHNKTNAVIAGIRGGHVDLDRIEWVERADE